MKDLLITCLVVASLIQSWVIYEVMIEVESLEVTKSKLLCEPKRIHNTSMFELRCEVLESAYD